MSVVTEYLERIHPAERDFFMRLRKIVYEIVPEAKDDFRYGIPTYTLHDKYLVGFYANKKFLSIYPGSEPIAALHTELTPFTTSKGTISFTLDAPLSDELLRSVVTLARGVVERNMKK